MNQSEGRLLSVEQIKDGLRRAVHATEESSSDLWALGVAERARVAAVAIHLKAVVPDSLAVDVEYNRRAVPLKPGQEPLAASDPSLIKRYLNASGESGIGTPDLLVHQRGRHEQNLLVAEFKNTHSVFNGWGKDFQKVSHWLSEFSYSVGAVIGLGPDETTFEPWVVWLDGTSPHSRTIHPVPL